MNENNLAVCDLCGQKVMEKDLIKHINQHLVKEDKAPQKTCDDLGCFI
jgi:hypothetical protein